MTSSPTMNTNQPNSQQQTAAAQQQSTAYNQNTGYYYPYYYPQTIGYTMPSVNQQQVYNQMMANMNNPAFMAQFTQFMSLLNGGVQVPAQPAPQVSHRLSLDTR